MNILFRENQVRGDKFKKCGMGVTLIMNGKSARKWFSVY